MWPGNSAEQLPKLPDECGIVPIENTRARIAGGVVAPKGMQCLSTINSFLVPPFIIFIKNCCRCLAVVSAPWLLRWCKY